MKTYFFEWLIYVTDWHVGHGGIGRLTTVKLHELSKTHGVTVEEMEVSPAGLKFKANKNPERLVQDLEAFLKQTRVDLRVTHPLFGLPQISTAA